MNFIIWLSVALLFFLFEVSIPGLFYAFSGVFGALVAAYFSWYGYTIFVQWSIFFITLLLFMFVANCIVATLFKATSQRKFNTDFLQGSTGITRTKIDFYRGGIVVVKGQIWSAYPLDEHEIIETGLKVLVVRVEGAHLVVKKA